MYPDNATILAGRRHTYPCNAVARPAIPCPKKSGPFPDSRRNDTPLARLAPGAGNVYNEMGRRTPVAL